MLQMTPIELVLDRVSKAFRYKYILKLLYNI